MNPVGVTTTSLSEIERLVILGNVAKNGQHLNKLKY